MTAGFIGFGAELELSHAGLDHSGLNEQGAGPGVVYLDYTQGIAVHEQGERLRRHG